MPNAFKTRRPLKIPCRRAARVSSPHVSFVDMGGHGYAVVYVTATTLETEFVCIPRPLERIEKPDGGTLRYRSQHSVNLWRKGERPTLKLRVVEGDAEFSV